MESWAVLSQAIRLSYRILRTYVRTYYFLPNPTIYRPRHRILNFLRHNIYFGFWFGLERSSVPLLALGRREREWVRST